MSEQKLLEIATRELWADFSQEAAFPDTRPLLAHYTSIHTFEKIVTTNEFWLSNPLFMNDLEELKFGMNEGAAEFYRSEELAKACGSKERYQRMCDAFRYLFSEFESKHALNTYVLCFSEHKADDNDGLLSMWRGYGNSGSGAAIVINTKNIVHTEDSPIIIGKVHYGTKSERLEWIGKKISTLAKVIVDHAKADDDIFYASLAWLTRLKSFALFSKHSGFKEEAEWRAVYMSDRDPEEKGKQFFWHLTTHRGIEPKLRLPIRPIDGVTPNDLSLEKIIDRIILGPSIASALSVTSLRQMLCNINHDALAARVVGSDIPFRPTN